MEQLINDMSASDLLAAFVGKFNDFVGEFDYLASERDLLRYQFDSLKTNQQEIALLKSQLDGYKRQCSQQDDDLAMLTKSWSEALKTEQAAHNATKARLIMVEKNNAGQSKELQELRQLNPQKLKEQIKRVKDASTDKDATIARLEREAEQYRQDLKSKQKDLNSAIDKIRYEQSMGLNNSAVGIYHKGDHHLVTWPQLMTIATEDGLVKQRPLIYMHNSGRGALLTINPTSKEVHMAESPKGGLKPPMELLEHAGMWLYNVNVTQKTLVTNSDFCVVDLNAGSNVTA